MLQELDVLIGFVVVMSVVSLLIMVATQAISSFLALRGRNLRDALVALFSKILPDVDSNKQLKQLAEKILRDPVFSDSSLSMKGCWPPLWKLSSAIRAEECLEVIHRIATSPYKTQTTSTEPDNLGTKIRESAHTVIAAIFKDEPETQAVHNEIKDAADKLCKALSSSPAKQAANDAIKAINNAVGQEYDTTQIEQEVRALVGKTQLELESWKKHFNAAQDRAEQWFTMNARWFTVALGFLAALILQLDTFELFSRISSDDALRNGLVNLSTAVEKRADEVSPGTVYFTVLKQMHNEDGDVKNFAAPQESYAQDYSGAKAWLYKQALQSQPSLDKEKQSQLIDRFNAAVQAKSKERLESAKQEFGAIAGFYGQSKLQLIPDPYWQGWPHFFGISKGPSHLFGMLATAMLLALGAPFWFNLLKSLTDLRSSVAEKIDKEKQVDKKK